MSKTQKTPTPAQTRILETLNNGGELDSPGLGATSWYLYNADGEMSRVRVSTLEAMATAGLLHFAPLRNEAGLPIIDEPETRCGNCSNLGHDSYGTGASCP